MKLIENNEFHKFVPTDDDSGILWICFSGRGYKPGKFTFFKTLSALKGDKLFFNCADNSWYLNDIEKINAAIKEATGKKQYKKTIFLGSSMGGYAAILFAKIHNGSQVLAFSPSLYLGSRFSWSGNLDIQLKYNDLTETLKNSAGPKPMIFLSVYDPFDMSFFRQFTAYEEFLEIYFLKCDHDTAMLLKKSGHLRKVLTAVQEDKDFSIDQDITASISDIETGANLYELLAPVYDGGNGGNIDNMQNMPEPFREQFFIKLLNECKMYKDNSRAIRISELALSHGAYPRAIKFFTEKNLLAKNYSEAGRYMPRYQYLYGNTKAGLRNLFKLNLAERRYFSAAACLCKLLVVA